MADDATPVFSIAAAWVLSIGIDLFLRRMRSLLMGWSIGQAAELAFAGGVLEAVADGLPLRRARTCHRPGGSRRGRGDVDLMPLS